MKHHVMQLTKAEKSWLEAFRKSLEREHPGAVQELLIYGSKARGQSHAESDFDVLLVVKEDYPDDTPYPSRLLLGWHNNRPLNIVVADNFGE